MLSLGRGLSIGRVALDASTVSRFIGVSRFVPCSFGALFHRGGFSTAEREALKQPTPFMRARTPRACGKAGVSLSAAGAACAGLRPSRVLSLPRPSGAALSAAFVERNAAKSGGRRLWFAAPERLPVGKSWRRQGERAGRSRAPFSASVESGRGGEPLATWGFRWCRLSARGSGACHG
jgi:hypothetical protein